MQGASWCGQEPSPRAPPALSLLIPPAACCPGFCGREPPRGQTRRYSRGQTAKTDRFPRCCPRLFAAAPVAPLQRNGPTPIIPPSYWPLGNSPLHVRPKVETGSGDALGERERRQQLEAQVPCFPTTCWTPDLFLPSSDEHFGSRALPFLSSPLPFSPTCDLTSNPLQYRRESPLQSKDTPISPLDPSHSPAATRSPTNKCPKATQFLGGRISTANPNLPPPHHSPLVTPAPAASVLALPTFFFFLQLSPL